jgi:predicted tellurium resistance membrane protein TerC
MSLDNVLAIAAAARNNLTVIILGIGLSIPIIVWGSTLVMRMLHRFPILVYLGAGILGYTAGEMLLRDEKVSPLIAYELLHYVIPIGLALLVIVIGLLVKQTRRSLV